MDSQSLQRIDRTSVKDLTLEQLKRYILSGAIQPGQKLPPERTLAEQLGVGRNSVREALKVLEAVGIIESRIGEGTFITRNAGATIGRTLGFNLAVWGGTIVEIHKARQTLEPGVAYSAAVNAVEADLQALTIELERMEATTELSPVYLDADLNFHRLVAQATHNAIVAHVVIDLINFLEEMLHQVDTNTLMTRAEGISTHRTLYEAIANHRPEEAAQRMRDHLRFATEFWEAVTSLSTSNPD